MKKLFIAYFFILAFCYNSFATLSVIPLDELVKDSDLIVVGTLKSVSEYSYGGEKNGKGRIIVEQVIAGSVKTNEGLPLKSGDKLKLVWREDFACIYGTHKRTENQIGVWFLKVEKDGTVISGHPSRFKSPEELSEIIDALKKERGSANQVKSPAKSIKTVDAEESGKEPIRTSDIDKSIKTVDVSRWEYSPFNAFLVIIASLFLYYFLYRSRFKIR
jgi:hypothetical protein